MNLPEINALLESILKQYRDSFVEKVFNEESSETDVLMQVFSLTQGIKAENRQYWGRELGMCWQRLVTELCRNTCSNFRNPIREGDDELCDLVVCKDAIDTKYRIGSGDSGTLKKFKSYGKGLKAMGLNPIMLIVRNDNLPAAITACKAGDWNMLTGKETFSYIKKATNFDLYTWLVERRGKYPLGR